jgi:hypothetical protein
VGGYSDFCYMPDCFRVSLTPEKFIIQSFFGLKKHCLPITEIDDCFITNRIGMGYTFPYLQVTAHKSSTFRMSRFYPSNYDKWLDAFENLGVNVQRREENIQKRRRDVLFIKIVSKSFLCMSFVSRILLIFAVIVFIALGSVLLLSKIF